jgi:hypothetical protein
MPVVNLYSSYSQLGYVAPTVYLLRGGIIPRWNYYYSKDQAITVFNGGTVASSAGSVPFTTNQVPQTFGINVDFYVLKNGSWQAVDYGYMKENNLPNAVIRMYTPTGTGPFWAVFNNKYFGASATKLSDYDPAKIAELDAFYREVALLKYRYNSLVGFLNTLGSKPLNSTEQQIFNQSLLMLQNLNNQISQIKGVEITYTQTGAIGIPVILIIGIIAIFSGVAAWTVLTIATEKEKTKRINDSYELSKWVATKKQEIAAQVQAGTLTSAQANEIYKTLDAAAALGNKIAEQSSKPPAGFFGDIKDLAKWGVIGLVAYTGYRLLTKNKQ